jgi:hypothetical protein
MLLNNVKNKMKDTIDLAYNTIYRILFSTRNCAFPH